MKATEELARFISEYPWRESRDAELSSELLEAVEAENAKLRELCADMYEMAYPEYPSAFEAAFADRMRELGVVDE